MRIETMTLDMDHPQRISELRATTARKGFLRKWYEETYEKYALVLSRAPAEGIALEIGSGPSFVKERLPEVVTSDIIPYEGVEKVVDATRMPFLDESLRALFMMNVLHHIEDPEAFFAEAQRCLKPGGILFMVDEHTGWFSKLVFGTFHHEQFRAEAAEWKFDSSGPLSGANGALAWIVFRRDLKRFEEKFPRLKLVSYIPHTPLRYWLAGGMRSWALMPGWAFVPVTWAERALGGLIPGFSCFVDIEVVKK